MGFKFGPAFVVAIILLIIVLAFSVNFIFLEKIEVGPVAFAQEHIECKVNSDCNPPDGSLCLKINEQEYSCGCLDNDDCPSKNCTYNKCSP